MTPITSTSPSRTARRRAAADRAAAGAITAYLRDISTPRRAGALTGEQRRPDDVRERLGQRVEARR